MDRLNIENYLICEVRPTQVGGQEVLFSTQEIERECGNDPKWDYLVEVTSSTGEIATGSSTQWHYYDSAYMAFKSAYRTACDKLGIEPLID